VHYNNDNKNDNNKDPVYSAVIKSHCESSPGSYNECRTVPDGCRPLDQADRLAIGPPVGC